jgi:hypothetical protein
MHGEKKKGRKFYPQEDKIHTIYWEMKKIITQILTPTKQC